MRLFSMKPAPSTTCPLPKRLRSDEVIETMLRSLSTTARYVVWPSSTAGAGRRQIRRRRAAPTRRPAGWSCRLRGSPAGASPSIARSGLISAAPRGRVFLRQQLAHRNRRHELRIAHPAVAIGKRQLERLGHGMQVRRAVVPHVAHVHPLEDVQRLQHHVALRVGRALVDVDALVVDVNRRVFERLVRRRDPSRRSDRRRSSCRRRTSARSGPDRTPAAALADLAQRRGEILLDDALAHFERRGRR